VENEEGKRKREKGKKCGKQGEECKEIAIDA